MHSPRKIEADQNIFDLLLESFNQVKWVKNTVLRKAMARSGGFNYNACFIGNMKVALTEKNGFINPQEFESTTYITWANLPREYRYRITAIVNKLIMQEYPDVIKEVYPSVWGIDKTPHDQRVDIMLPIVLWNDHENTTFEDVQKICQKGAAMYAEKYM